MTWDPFYDITDQLRATALRHGVSFALVVAKEGEKAHTVQTWVSSESKDTVAVMEDAISDVLAEAYVGMMEDDEDD